MISDSVGESNQNMYGLQDTTEKNISNECVLVQIMEKIRIHVRVQGENSL